VWAGTPTTITVHGMAFVQNSTLYNCSWTHAMNNLSLVVSALVLSVSRIQCVTPEWPAVANRSVDFELIYDG
jgi:hypothetical protein